MKNIRNMLLIIGCIMFVSCRDYLDIKPKGTLIPTTYSEFSKILDYEYNFKLSDDVSDIFSDDVYLYGSVYSSWLSAPMQRAYKWESPVFYSGDFDDAWSSSYSRIFNFNFIIKEIDGAELGTLLQKKNLKAEAYLSRAFEYLRLVQKYGKPYDSNTSSTDLAVPLRLEPVVSPEILSRASVQTVLDQVKSDLDIALSSELPEVAEQKHRGSKAGAYGLYAKMYLYMRDYAKVYEYADSALQLVGSPVPLEDYNNYQIVDSFGGRGRTNLPDANNNVETVYLKLSEQLPSGYVFISNSLKSLYSPGDKRFGFYFANPYYGAVYETEMFARHLYMNLGVGTSELLLLRAEAAARQNNLSQAIADLNALRSKRLTNDAYGTGYHSNIQKDVIKMILDERRRELCFLNGSRFFDMKRLSKDVDFQTPVITRLVDGETYLLETESSKYAFPIWLKVIESNPGMQQN
ncbi:MAG: RagB/SusD family nutrient uptake outer membrane protein [Bacteroidales bacterium]|nr:RagB/SusD family nutrient uptake outer membrane protein [Bacteroidales bacterium]MDD3989808.1 RagB/SusD family nutrient uptake outer membrane protein [Bacteroidales bacterium]